MARLKVKLTEMKNADVRFISLVKRGANRIPFRVIKSLKESQMGIDLSSIRLLKSEKPVPTVVGIVVNASEDGAVAAVSEAIKAAGFTVANVHKYEDGTAMFAQGELPEDGEGTLVRLSDNVVIVVKNADDQAEAMSDASDLHPELQAEGFFFGPEVATKAMQAAVAVAVKSEDSAKAIKTATEKFQAYMAAVSELAPTAVLKMEEGIGLALTKYEEEKAAKAEADKAAAEKAEKEAAEKAEKEAADKAAADAAAAANPEGKDAAAKTEDKSAEILAALVGLTEAVTALKSDVAGVKESQSKLEGQVQEVAAKAEKATTAVATTVVAGAGKGDEPQGKAQKDEHGEDFITDTAFSPRKRK